ncbi:MAG: glycosyl hydrolase family 28-related protein, partial [Pirellulales bacterium]
MAINWIDVTASPYNAAGDGTTDDTSAIQSAINAAGSNGVVYFPALTYKTSGTLTAAYDNHTWLMYGATILADFDGIAVRFGSFSAAKQNNSVYGGNIYRTSSPSSTGWTIGNIGWQWLNFSRFYHVDYQIRGFHIGQQLLGEGLAIDEVDITINSPAEFTTSVSHNLVAGNIVYFSTTGTLPTGLDEETPYYVVAAGLTGTTFRVSSTSDLMNVVTTTGSQSGTHTLWRGITFGTQSGHLVPRHLLSNKVGISCTARNGGWCNENAFFGAGRVGNLSSDPDQSAGYMIHLERGQRTPNLLNNNKFYGLCLENAKSSNKPKAVYCDAIYTLFDHCRYEGFDADFIDNSGDDFLSGGNIFRGGIGLTTPGDCLVDPTVGLYQFVGARASVHGGGSSTEAAWAVRDLNSANNKSFRVQNTDGTDWFKIDGLGRTEIGFNSGGSLDAKLAVINDSFSTKTMVLRQKASPVGPAIEVQKSAGNPVFTVRKNTSG